MAKKSKSRFTDLVKFVPDTEVPVYEDYDDNNEIRTNLLDAQYDDTYDEYDEYDEYSEDVVETIEEVENIPEVEVIDTLEDIKETANVKEDDMDEKTNSIYDNKDEFDDLDLIEDIKPIRATYKKPESLSVNPPKEEKKVSTMEDSKPQNNMAPKKSTRQTEVTVDLDDLQKAMLNNNSKINKEDYKMKRDIPDFIKEDDLEMEVHVPQQHKHNAPQQPSYASPVVDPTNMKESIILGNTTIKGDIITDSGIQIFGAVIGNIQSGGRVQLVGKVEGDISGHSVVITNTSLNGNIHAEQDVTVKTGCVVTGDVSGNKIILNGTIRGNIDAEGQVDFEAGSVIDGNVSAKSFNIKPGARINGSISTK